MGWLTDHANEGDDDIRLSTLWGYLCGPCPEASLMEDSIPQNRLILVVTSYFWVFGDMTVVPVKVTP